MNPPTNCLECGAALTTADAGGLCPKCLLRLGLASQLVSGTMPVTATGLTPDGAVLEPFDFGGYRILRLLGKGGMGAVYEADQLASGRRVALKVLGTTLDTPEMRARFIREGQLAAAVRHDKVVAVLGAEEIEGTPVIAMELLHDGTLKDRVKKRGPLPVAEAVDAVLQIIDGLEAAHAVGVLHRDVKPANCFSSADGSVKVGDFGLSISTLAKAEHSLTQSGAVLGTPAFAAPEQLRGQEIDVRADIYAVGATLYFLLTGKPTHDADSLVALIAAVLEKKPTDVRVLRPESPRGLAQSVMRCLEKDPARRFQNYAALRSALEPFSSAAPTAATLGLRFVAGVIDGVLASLPEFIALVTTADSVEAIWLTQRTAASVVPWLLGVAWAIAYFAVQEGVWGTTLGKMLCGLRVARVNGEPIGAGAALLRAFVFNSAIIVAPLYALAVYSVERYRDSVARADLLFSDLLLGILSFGLFITMRRRNGFAAIHDLISGSRVVSASVADATASVAPFAAAPVPAKIDGPRIGAFAVTIRHGDLIEAVDDVLRRRVWIISQPAGAPELPASRRDLARPTRLRWLQGRRSPEENWDAYEAPAGASLVSLANGQQPWSRVRRWLSDLAEECTTALRDGTQLAEVGADRVWITPENRAVLLDFHAPATPPTKTHIVREAASLQGFLSEIAQSTLTPLRPLHARALIDTLAIGRLEAPEIVAGNLRAALAKPAAVSPRRRLFTLALGPLIALVLGLVLCGVLPVENRRFDTWWQQNYRGAPSLRRALEIHSEYGLDAKTKEALDRHLAGHFANLADDDTFWSRPEVQRSLWLQVGFSRDLVRTAVAQYPQVTAQELSNADEALKPKFAEWARFDRIIGPVAGIGMVLACVALGVAASLLWAALAGTPLGLRLFGLAIVTRAGTSASRLRVVARTVIASLPIIAIVAAWTPLSLSGKPTALGVVTILAALAVLAASFIHALIRTTRSFADVLMRTSIVPR
jgi:uncharacterized RDD family membrane protein YckC